MLDRLMDIGGAVVFWSLGEWSNRARLEAEFSNLGLLKFVPEPRLPSAALRDALDAVCSGPRLLIRPLAKRDGFAVVREQRGESSNDYVQELVARVLGDSSSPQLRFDPWDQRANQVEEAFRQQLGLLSATQIGTALVKVVDYLGGTRLRPSGAVYWLPGHRLNDWVDVSKAIESAFHGKPGALYLVRHRLDADAVRAVRDAVIAEVQQEVRRIHDDVVTGQLGTRALESRREQASDLRKKVLLYEELLDVGLAALHQAVDDADQATASAAMLIGAGSTTNGLAGVGH